MTYGRIGMVDRDGRAVDMSEMVSGAAGQVDMAAAMGESTDSPASDDGSMIGILKYLRTLLSSPLAITSTVLSDILLALPPQPNVFKTIAAADISSETTLWTPASGKKWRLMGGIITVTGATGNVVLKDGNSGATIFNIPNSVVGTPIPLQLGNGILSVVANNNLRAQGTTLQLLNGTIWGIEA